MWRLLMPQPIDTSPPWWDGTIAIAFSVDEWKFIINNLNWEYVPMCGDPESGCGCAEAANIIDRIEKGIGIE